MGGSRRGRVQDSKSGKFLPVKSTIAGEQSLRLVKSMCADKKVGDDAVSGTPLSLTAATPEVTRPFRRFRGERFEADSEDGQGFMESSGCGKVSPHFTPDHIAGDEGSGVVGSSERLAGAFSEVWVGTQDIQQHR